MDRASLVALVLTAVALVSTRDAFAQKQPPPDDPAPDPNGDGPKPEKLDPKLGKGEAKKVFAEKAAAVKTAAAASEIRTAQSKRAEAIKAYLDSGEIAKAETLLAEYKADEARLKEVESGDAKPDTETEKKDDAAKKTVQEAVEGAAGSAGCSGKSRWCLYGGVQLVGYSLTFGSGVREGQTGHHIVEIAVPTVGLRAAITRYLSLDFAFYTAIISPQFQLNTSNPSGTGCARKPNTFEDLLPCEGNAALRPYVGSLVGLTVGTGGTLGVLTIGPTWGFARTAQDPSAFAFGGLMISTGGVYATIPVGKLPTPPADAVARKEGGQ